MSNDNAPNLQFIEKPDSWLKREFSISNVVSLGTILLAIGIAWARLDSKAESDHAQIAEMKQSTQAQVNELKQSLNSLNGTLIDTNLLVRELSTTVRLDSQRRPDK